MFFPSYLEIQYNFCLELRVHAAPEKLEIGVVGLSLTRGLAIQRGVARHKLEAPVVEHWLSRGLVEQQASPLSSPSAPWWSGRAGLDPPTSSCRN